MKYILVCLALLNFGCSVTKLATSQQETELPSQGEEPNGNNQLPPDAQTPGPQVSCVTPVFTWGIPTERVNGDVLTQLEIGGFEIRGKLETDSVYQTLLMIPWQKQTTETYFSGKIQGLAPGKWTVHAYAYDTNGLYSEASSPDKTTTVCANGTLNLQGFFQ